MLTRLATRHFRNLEPLTWEPGPGSHLLLGDNGAGKTSLLEAAYVVATTRSFRTSQLADCRRHGEPLFHLEAEVVGEARSSLAVTWGGEVRRRTLNGSEAPLAEHLGAQPVVAWTAADAEALTGAPRLRRRLLDRGVLGLRPAALETLSRFRQVLVQKRSLLAAGGRELATWNEIFAATAAPVIALRQAYFERLTAAFATMVAASGLALPPLALAYRPSPRSGVEGAEAIATALAAAVEAERQRGQPLVGPQRDDLEIRFGDREIRRVASAGERKAVGLLLAAAHGRVLEAAGRSPIYLFDDADAELSPTTLGAVWGAVVGQSQVFASSNRPVVWERLAIDRRWCLEKGRLETG